jgi:hypothetical protein
METVAPEGYQFPRGQESVSVWSSNVDGSFFETREFGIRMAIGADRLQVVKMIRKQAGTSA